MREMRGVDTKFHHEGQMGPLSAEPAASSKLRFYCESGDLSKILEVRSIDFRPFEPTCGHVQPHRIGSHESAF